MSPSAWGRFEASRFDADVDEVRMEGEVTTGFVGADLESGRWLAGVALGLSRGEGTFALANSEAGHEGEIESSLTALYPYARMRVNDRVDVWGLAGLGHGELTLSSDPDDERRQRTYRTDIGMRLGAVGARGKLLPPTRPGGPEVAVKSDAMWVRTTSEPVPGLMGSEAQVRRVRLVLEGSRTFEASPGTLTPALELGLRHDGGDAETGTGIEAGATLRYEGAGFSVEGAVRKLVAHEDPGYEDWGAAGAVRIDPGRSGRGLSLTIAPSRGETASATERLWSPQGVRGLAPSEAFQARQKLDARIGYGLGPRHAPGVVTTWTGVSLASGSRRTARAGIRWAAGPRSDWSLEAGHNGKGEVRTQGQIRF